MNGDLLQGFYLALAPTSILATALGALHGLICGMMPGLTTSAGIIILFPVTFILEPTTAVALLLGVFAGGMTGGSFAAILINIPGSPSASATTMDGFPLTQKGEAGRALGVSIVSSFTGGLFSFFCLILIAPQLTKVALQFRAADLFGLVFFGMSVISAFAAKSLVKGLLSTFLGLMIVTVGMDPLVGTARFTFGDVNMLAGIHFIPALVGLFAIPEIVANLAEGNIRSVASRFGRVFPSWADIKKIRLPVTIGSVVGTFVGILPGAGGPIAVFVSYDYAQKINKEPEQFGKGCVEGVAAPESANSSIAGGALIPMMTLGIPGDPITAILIGALLVHGMAPGPLLFVEQGPFAFSVLFSYFIAICSTATVAFLGLRVIVKLLSIPRSLLLPIIVALCVLGTYALRNSFFDIYVMFFFGLVALSFKWLDIPVVPMLLALVLGRQLEEHMRVALAASKGDISIFFTSPWCLFFLCLSVISFSWPFYLEWRVRKRALEKASASAPSSP